MSGTRINRPRPNKCIDIILDKDFNKIVPKPVNNHPVFDIEYLRACVINYNIYYANQFEKVFEVEKRYDNLSAIRSHETSQQWLFVYGGREVAIGYYRPIIHNSKMAICFNCWKLVKITDINQKKRHISVDGRDMGMRLSLKT
ncbi:hypothetical protein GLOIN_2v1770221 [Rhizophagus clarus]|uniref:Uncharacterized protein n=1 Tax=Rhizophagus clarus TaxID=94130 RepID=A0A8H3L1W0_9GLOM|nr:hypothetical protein GLOIN_2v1770221 [Rhizophagus clarus]